MFNGKGEILQSIMDNTVDGLISIDEKGMILTYNKACEHIFGYEAEEAIGQNVKILMPEPYKAEHDGYLADYIRTGKRKIIGIGREVMGRRKDGSVFPIDLSVSEVAVDGHRLFSGIVRDISERKKAEEEIMRSNEELERFAYIASHDLQEPLRMVSNFTQLLEEEYGPEMDEQAREYMGFIVDASRRMQELVFDLLEYSRLNTDDSGFSEFDSTEQVEAVLRNLGETIREKGAVVQVGAMPHIYGSPLRFSRLIENLVANAIKYAEKGKAPIVSVEAEERKEDWLFKVSDQGIGIKPEYLTQIFIIFKRLHNKQEYGGTGIGLAICKKIVESFGGKIWVESVYGEGSTFFFTVPKKLSSDQEIDGHYEKTRQAG